MFYLRDLKWNNDDFGGTATGRVNVMKLILVNHIQLKGTYFKIGRMEF